MLVDIILRPEDMLMVQRGPDGKTTISIPLDVLTRAHAAYLANQAHFDTAAQTERRVQ